VPIVTKWLFAGSFGLTVAANFGLVPWSLLILSFDKVFKDFEVWRLVTCFFFHGKLGFPFLMHMVRESNEPEGSLAFWTTTVTSLSIVTELSFILN
jgi:hypothetical protein